MRKRIPALVLSAFLLAGIASLPAKAVKTDAASVGDISITVNHGSMAYYNDGYNRLKVVVSNKEGTTMENAKLRLDNLSLTPKIGINGTDYTFTTSMKNGVSQGINAYVASFCQELTNSDSDWPLFFKRDPGQGASGNLSFYNEDWPGVPKNEETVIEFYKDEIFGEYRLNNDFAFRVSADGGTFDFIYNPHSVNITGGTLSGTYAWKDMTSAASEDATITIIPDAVDGRIVESVTVCDAATMEPTSITVTLLSDGSYSFVMPSYPVYVSVNSKAITYELTCGENTIEVTPGETIGNELPEGRWEIDGYPISSESIYVWKESKTAVLSRYTLKLFVDDVLFDTITYTSEDTVTLPAIPYKEGYRIEGWSIQTLPYHDCTAYAVYSKI